MEYQVISEFYKVLNDLHYATKNARDFSVLCYIIRLKNNKGDKMVFPSLTNIRKVCKMSRDTANNAIKSLVEDGLIVKKNNPYKPNEYDINMDGIFNAILRNLPTEVLKKRAEKELSQQQKFMASVRNAVENPEVAHKAEAVLGNRVINDDAEIVNDIYRRKENNGANSRTENIREK